MYQTSTTSIYDGVLADRAQPGAVVWVSQRRQRVNNPPPQPCRAPRDVKMEDAAPPEVEEQIIGSDDILGEEKRDDTKD
jgi:hypothetical protein